MTAATAVPRYGLSSGRVGSGGGVAEPRPADAGPSLWHRIGQSGTLRAAIFGVSDGLVSNLALVMGVAAATTDGRMVVLAGLAGLLAGSFSMAAGEWISMTSPARAVRAPDRPGPRAMPDHAWPRGGRARRASTCERESRSPRRRAWPRG